MTKSLGNSCPIALSLIFNHCSPPPLCCLFPVPDDPTPTVALAVSCLTRLSPLFVWETDLSDCLSNGLSNPLNYCSTNFSHGCSNKYLWLYTNVDDYNNIKVIILTTLPSFITTMQYLHNLSEISCMAHGRKLTSDHAPTMHISI